MIKHLRDMLRRLLWSGVLSVAAVVPAGAAHAALFAPGTPTTNVPTALVDSLGALSSGLQNGQFLLPIQVTGASGLQEWSFDLTFDENVVAPEDDQGGNTQIVFPAVFNDQDSTESSILTSGNPVAGVLQGIGGFSSDVSGDGLLAFVLFKFLEDQEEGNPNFSIENQDPPIQRAPEPGTMLLLAVALLTLGWMQRASGARRRVTAG
jgi:hypothetical protein